MKENKFTCRICKNHENNVSFFVKEMLFGTEEKFEYVECANCKCIQIKEIPENLEVFYPENYVSFVGSFSLSDNFIKYFFKKKMAKDYLQGRKTLISSFLQKKYGLSFVEKIKPTNINFNSKILDIGSGNGNRIIGLSKYGFNNITGVDPFIKEDLLYNKKVKIYKKNFYDLYNKYDLVMLNHSFEHMTEPKKVLKKLNTFLDINSFALIRVPVSNSYAWKKYRENWVALDAPRHIYLHNTKTMELLSEQTGFYLEHVIYDSTEYQFVGSEQYSKGISMFSEKSYYQNKNKSIFSDEQIKHFEAKAKELNKMKQGDAACFYLKKIKEIQHIERRKIN
ncbi:MAG: hypothetical protein CR986_01715 [Ignavibacteriae bacterium]|nr:MAG: hypothetical protein CR986_01715 [Ignavibacteriota bacterium]